MSPRDHTRQTPSANPAKVKEDARIEMIIGKLQEIERIFQQMMQLRARIEQKEEMLEQFIRKNPKS